MLHGDQTRVAAILRGNNILLTVQAVNQFVKPENNSRFAEQIIGAFHLVFKERAEARAALRLSAPPPAAKAV